MPAPKEKLANPRPNSQEISSQPSHEEIAILAYYLYLDRGAADGQDLTDWLEAEAQLVAEQSVPVTTPLAKAKIA
jgi:hypothetical protein